MKVTDASLYTSYLRGFRAGREDVARLVQQLADGKRIGRPSDDPAGARVALSDRARLARLEGYKRSAGFARFDLTALDDALGAAIGLVTEARTTAMAGASGPGQSGNDIRATEIDHLRAQLLDLANTQQDGRYLFAGTSTLTPAFDAAGAYAGDDVEATAPIDDSIQVGSTLSGRRAFVAGGDLFVALSDLATALRNDDTAAIQALVPVLGAKLDSLAEIRGEVGARMRMIDGTLERHAGEGLRLEQRIAEIEDVDLERVALELSAATGSLDALSASAARVLERSLFDFLG